MSDQTWQSSADVPRAGALERILGTKGWGHYGLLFSTSPDLRAQACMDYNLDGGIVPVTITFRPRMGHQHIAGFAIARIDLPSGATYYGDYLPAWAHEDDISVVQFCGGIRDLLAATG